LFRDEILEDGACLQASPLRDLMTVHDRLERSKDTNVNVHLARERTLHRQQWRGGCDPTIEHRDHLAPKPLHCIPMAMRSGVEATR
jgi:hypothetical protein